MIRRTLPSRYGWPCSVSARSALCSRRIRPSATRRQCRCLWERAGGPSAIAICSTARGAPTRAPDPGGHLHVRPPQTRRRESRRRRSRRPRARLARQAAAARQQPGRRGPGRSRAVARAVRRRLSPAARSTSCRPSRSPTPQGTHVVPGGRFRLEDPSMKARGTWSWRDESVRRHAAVRGPARDPARVQQLGSQGLEQHDLRRRRRRRSRALVCRPRSRRGARRDRAPRAEAQQHRALRAADVHHRRRRTASSSSTIDGWQPGLVRHAITSDDVRWAAALLAGLSDRQWHDAFRAGGYPDDLSERFIRKLKANIAAGAAIAGGMPAATGGREAVNVVRRLFPAIAFLFMHRRPARCRRSRRPRCRSRPDSLKFAVIGDNGTGDSPEYDVGARMTEARQAFPFELVIMLGDNMYGRQQPQDFVDQVRAAVRAAARRPASASTRRSATTTTRTTAPIRGFNMGGERYYTLRQEERALLRARHATSWIRSQLAWIDNALKQSPDEWKICYFHHPLYSDGGRHGSDVELARRARAAVREVRRQRRVLGTRPHLRADQAAERASRTSSTARAASCAKATSGRRR